jgi:glycerol-3-phosphate acyltransferase PlsY
MIWFIIIISYLFGSIPSGYLVAKSEGIDIRQDGSKNIGAANVLRVMGREWGCLVFCCDAFKGFFAVRLAMNLGGFADIDSAIAGVVAAIACVLGHRYNHWFGFKGSNGIATAAGVIVALFPWFIILIVALVWVTVFSLCKYVSLASICAAASLPVSLALTSAWGGSDSFWLVIFSVVAAALAL